MDNDVGELCRPTILYSALFLIPLRDKGDDTISKRKRVYTDIVSAHTLVKVTEVICSTAVP